MPPNMGREGRSGECGDRPNPGSHETKPELYLASPTVEPHRDDRLDTRYMHVAHFSLTLDRDTTVDRAIGRLHASTGVAITLKRSG